MILTPKEGRGVCRAGQEVDGSTQELLDLLSEVAGKTTREERGLERDSELDKSL